MAYLNHEMPFYFRHYYITNFMSCLGNNKNCHFVNCYAISEVGIWFHKLLYHFRNYHAVSSVCFFFFFLQFKTLFYHFANEIWKGNVLPNRKHYKSAKVTTLMSNIFINMFMTLKHFSKWYYQSKLIYRNFV